MKGRGKNSKFMQVYIKHEKTGYQNKLPFLFYLVLLPKLVIDSSPVPFKEEQKKWCEFPAKQVLYDMTYS